MMALKIDKQILHANEWVSVKEALEKELAYEMLFGNAYINDEELSLPLIGNGRRSSVVMVIQIDSDSDTYDAEIVSRRQEIVYTALRALHESDGYVVINGRSCFYAVMVDNKEIAMVVFTNEDSVAGGFCKQFSHYVKAFLEQRIDFSISIGIGNRYSDCGKIRTSYREACLALQYKFYEGNRSLLYYQDINCQYDDGHLMFIDNESRLVEYIRKGKWDQTVHLLDVFFDQIARVKEIQPQILKIRMLEMLTVISRVAIDLGVSIRVLLDLKVRAGIEIENIMTLREMRTWLSGIMQEFGLLIKQRQIDTTARAVIEVKQYIHKYYARAITLEILAEQVLLSPHYLSRIFSEQVQLSITEYVKQVRIAKAQSLLLATSKTIAEIANVVGYNDPNYFSRVFKCTTGLSPQQYRRGEVV